MQKLLNTQSKVKLSFVLSSAQEQGRKPNMLPLLNFLCCRQRLKTKVHFSIDRNCNHFLSKIQKLKKKLSTIFYWKFEISSVFVTICLSKQSGWHLQQVFVNCPKRWHKIFINKFRNQLISYWIFDAYISAVRIKE